MAKKKKKQLRLNQTVRRLFDGEAFETGIDHVDTDSLRQLIGQLGITPEDEEHETLVRTLRRFWSDAGVEARDAIVAFLKQVELPTRGSLHGGVERTDKIDMLLQTMDVTPDEAVMLHEAFSDIRTRKITKQKLQTKLEHIRFVTKRSALETALKGQFDLTDRLEFHGVLTYTRQGETFRKIHPLKTPVFSYTFLKEGEEAELIREIEASKAELTAAAQGELDTFLRSIPDPHPYLEPEQILQALRTAPPEAPVTLPPLENVLLQKVLGVAVAQTEEEVVLSRPQRFRPEGFTAELACDVHVPVPRTELLKAIWRGEPLDFTPRFEAAAASERETFNVQLQQLCSECQEYARLLELSDGEVYAWLETELVPHLGDSLIIASKLWRRVRFHFERHTHEALLKRQRRELLARTIRDFKNLFPLARDLRRRLIFYTGPTNSGKTYQAMQALRQADTGYYLAPLRLLALEGYETLRSFGIHASLITGEEQLIDDETTHVSSTIEMLDFNTDVDVCVIDEVQMLADRDRGWAWANAIIGAPARTIILTGSVNAVEAVEALAAYLGEPLEVIRCERKNPLEMLPRATPIGQIRPATAIVAFSRKEVLQLKQQLSRHYRVSVVYGNLSPEVRREEARRFREGETEVLVATDAIAMGLNLPIQTLLFARGDKFDGEKQRSLFAWEVHQISGRAGRFGIKEKGYVGALKPEVLHTIHTRFREPAHPITQPFNVMANLEHIKLVGRILEEESLEEILNFFGKHMQFTGPFRAANIESMLEAAAIVDRYALPLESKYHLAGAPLTLKSPYIVAAYERYVRTLAQDKPVTYVPPTNLSDYAVTMEELLEAEDRVKEISLYLWLGFRFSDHFVDREKAHHFRGVLNRFIETSLKQSEFVPRCRQCTKPLPLNSPYSICQSCFHKLNKMKRRGSHKSATP